VNGSVERLTVSLALTPGAWAGPILTGAVRVDGVRLIAQRGSPPDIFFRQLHHDDFDVSEMSLASLIIAHQQGDDRWVALPVFSGREASHARILVRAGAGIERPADLVQRRVGLPEYQMTAAVWSRGALQHEFGVRPDQLLWFSERSDALSHGGATAFAAPEGVSITEIPPTSSLHELIERGELDAIVKRIGRPSLLDRSPRRALAPEAVRPLFADPRAEQARYFRALGFTTVNHVLVVRRTLLERHRWVALNLYQAFVRARELVLADARAVIEEAVAAGALNAGGAEPSLSDVSPHGLAPNRPALQTLCRYLHEQGLIEREPACDDLFAESVRAL
jgi:4,5-dihydroxyphthalate decarboxylase